MIKLNTKLAVVLLCLTVATSAFGQPGDSDSAYLNWTADKVKQIGDEFRDNGSVGRIITLRGFDTERAVNYDLRATLMTPEMIRASARLAQLRNRLSDEQTRALVREAEEAGDIIVIVELDPREGSGVIPLDWRVFLQPKGLKPGSKGAIAGIKSPQLRNFDALKGVFRRDYDFDLFFVAFPLVDENKVPLISPDANEIELLVGIYKTEGSVSWRMPDSLRERMKVLSLGNTKEEIR